MYRSSVGTELIVWRKEAWTRIICFVVALETAVTEISGLIFIIIFIHQQLRVKLWCEIIIAILNFNYANLQGLTILMTFIYLRWEPLTIETTSPPILAPAQPSGKFYLLLYSAVPVLVLLVIGLAGAYIYKQRKSSQFSSLSQSEDGPVSPPTPTIIHRWVTELCWERRTTLFLVPTHILFIFSS